MPIVVKVDTPEWRQVPANRRLYIGRAVPRRLFRESEFANPYCIGVDGDRSSVLWLYAIGCDLRRLDGRRRVTLARRTWEPPSPEQIATLLDFAVLGCWCAPEPCHGDYLLRVARGEDPISAALAVAGAARGVRG